MTSKIDDESFDVLKGAPQSIALGYKTFRIMYLPISIFSEELGRSEHTKGVIVVDPTFSPAEVVNTFVHECLHLMWTNSQAGKDGDAIDEEKIVIVMANGLVELFARNPDVTKWITRCLSC
jgi:hypothetical protein